MARRLSNRYVQISPHTVVEITPELMEAMEKERRASLRKLFLYGVALPLAILAAIISTCILLRLS